VMRGLRFLSIATQSSSGANGYPQQGSPGFV
jgi:hypothetical protein